MENNDLTLNWGEKYLYPLTYVVDKNLKSNIATLIWKDKHPYTTLIKCPINEVQLTISQLRNLGYVPLTPSMLTARKEPDYEE